MCGIAGIVRLKKDYNHDNVIRQMLDAVKHRGPDGEGILLEGDVALGHRRLAIIDLTDHGAQPMTDISKRLTIVYNGEIYNYIELRRELEKKGRCFKTESDTEVLLQAYDEWGENCVSKLNGMWAFSIFDREKNILFCSRDRFGEKPFYYANTSYGFVFGSEIRQLLPEMDRVKGNSDLISRFLLGVTGDDPRNSFFSGVHKLPAGHNLIYDLSSHKFSIARYYEIAYHKEILSSSFTESKEYFYEILKDSVKMRMRSDVSVGTCLSGGLDSSSIAALASEFHSPNSTQPFKAITACSTEAKNDETPYAASVVNFKGLEWIKTTPDYEGFSEYIDDVFVAQEEPFGSASIVMQYCVMQEAAKNGVRVLLDGQGGDEVLMGYERYYIPYFRQLLRTCEFGKVLHELNHMTKNNSVMSLMPFLKYAIYFSNYFIREQRIKRRSDFLRNVPDSIAEVRNYAKAAKSVFDLQKYEVETSNLPPLLRFEDKNAMRFSVETRLPILDHRIVELGCNLPVSHKIRDGWTKYILREAIKDHLPEDIVWRKNKIGFAAPQRTWMSNHRNNMIKTIEGSEILQELVKLESLKKHDYQIDDASFWRLFAVARWESNFSLSGL
ncbi:asparagine synthase (glutamine-hydrolyzing) [Neptuniibacter sp. SY11_33]|uniref:asparagine synthase (glutamine-hydrolyzing) n=1 Tax=Neptuniibacter sp. SY11_33 TaxID=3398215 RepID=UPI0039F5DB5B